MPIRSLSLRSLLALFLALLWPSPLSHAGTIEEGADAARASAAAQSSRVVRGVSLASEDPQESAMEFVYVSGGYKRKHLRWDTYLISWPDLKNLTPGDDLAGSLPTGAFGVEVPNTVLGNDSDVEVNELFFGPNGDAARVPEGLVPRGVRVSATVSHPVPDARVSVDLRIYCGGRYSRAVADFLTSGSQTFSLETQLLGDFTLEEVRQTVGMFKGETEVLPFEPLQGVIDRLNFSLDSIEMTMLHDPIDLTVEAIRPQEPLTDASDSEIDFDVRNLGSGASSACEYEILVDENMAVIHPLDAIAPGALLTLSSVNVGHLSEGTHTVTVRVDSGGTVPESDETNNELDVEVTVSHVTRARSEWMLFD